LRKSRIYAVGALGLAAALALSACSSGATGGSSSSIGTPNGKGKTLTVWSMTGDLSAATLGAINAKFTTSRASRPAAACST
jgi:N,N'-diacetylchitobiose transport system substrate-binding protein